MIHNEAIVGTRIRASPLRDGISLGEHAWREVKGSTPFRSTNLNQLIIY